VLVSGVRFLFHNHVSGSWNEHFWAENKRRIENAAAVVTFALCRADEKRKSHHFSQVNVSFDVQ